MSIPTSLHTLHTRRLSLLSAIYALNAMLPGSYNEGYRKCGKHNCWCASAQQGHPLRYLTWLDEQGTSRSKSVREADAVWVKSMTDAYRTFRQLRRELLSIDKEIKNIVDTHAKDMVEKTRQSKDSPWKK